MALSGFTIWEVQTGGSDTANGGAFDPSQTAGMLTDGAATSATGASPVFSSASYTFVAGDAGDWVYIASGTNWIPGWYKIASVSGGNATLVATIGQAVKSIGIPTTVLGCATTASPSSATWTIDRSQQGAVHQSYTDLASSGAGLTVSSAAHPFNKQDVGNAIRVTSGTNFTAGIYVIASVDVSHVATVVGAGNITSGVGSSGNGALGGALASPGYGVSQMLPSNWCFVKSGTYTITTTSPGAAGPVKYSPGSDATGANPSRIIGYGSVRGDNGTKPLIKLQASLTTSAIEIFSLDGTTNKYVEAKNFELDAATGNTTCIGLALHTNFNFASRFKISHTTVLGLALGDTQNRVSDIEVANYSGTAGVGIVSPGPHTEDYIEWLTVHDGTADAINLYPNGGSVSNALIYNITGNGVVVDFGGYVADSTIYNCSGVGLYVVSRTSQNDADFTNVLVYGSGGYGFGGDSSTDQIHRMRGCAGGNNASGNFNPSSIFGNEYTQGDFIALTVNPFRNPGGQDFALNNTAGGGALLRNSGTPHSYVNQLNYRDIGALQHLATILAALIFGHS
jgi:hypothetical protein